VGESFLDIRSSFSRPGIFAQLNLGAPRADSRPVRPVFAVALAVALLGGAVDARHALSRPRAPHHHGFALALDRVAQEISGRRDVSVRCGTTADPSILGSVTFYGASPGREALLAPPVCATLHRLWEGRHPSLACTELGHGQCGQDVLELAWAASALAHESWHLGGVRNEAAAECYGLQSTALAARRLGAPPAYAARLETYTFWNVRPPVDYGYFSPECRDGGTLDLRPAVAAWP
jgi:hypothetical protein